MPIVLVNVTDPVGAGFVDSLARPGGNITGFLSFEYGLAGKWLELLEQIAPGVTRAGGHSRHRHIRGAPASSARSKSVALVIRG